MTGIDKTEWYTTREVAAAFRVDGRTVARWRRDGKLTPDMVTLGGHARYRASRIRELTGQDKGDQA
jgi:predicted site-specific integrase-resolvase